MPSRQPRRGFSSLQLVVLLAILLFLLAFALPIIQRIRAAAVRVAACGRVGTATVRFPGAARACHPVAFVHHAV